MVEKKMGILSKAVAAIAQACISLKEKTKELYCLVKENCKPALKTTGNLIRAEYKAANERWLMNQQQRQLLEAQQLSGRLARDFGIVLRHTTLPKAMPLDLGNLWLIEAKPVGVNTYDISIPLVSPQILPDSLFPEYTTLWLNRTLERYRTICIQRQIPPEQWLSTYYMVIVAMSQPNDMFITVRIRLIW